MRNILIFLGFCLLSGQLLAQYNNSINKMRLGAQTTGDGLIFRTDSIPDWTPTGLNNAWLAIDTLTGNAYSYQGSEWRLEVAGDLRTVYPLVINKSGVDIKRGQPVMVDYNQLIQGDLIRILPADGSGVYSTKLTMGIASTDIANNAEGYITWFGYVREVKQSDIMQTGDTADIGDILYLSPTQVGRLTDTEPTAPANKVTMALVVRKPNANNITLLVRPQLNEDLGELNDVDLTGLLDGQIIVWDSINSKWIAGNVGSLIDTTVIATRAYVDGKVDSTRLVQDSILVYYIGGVEVGRDTIAIPAAGITSFTLAGTSGTPQTITDGNTMTIAAGVGISTTAGATDQVTVAADTATVLATKTFLSTRGYTTGSGTTGTIPIWSSSTALGNSALTEASGSVTAGGTGFFRLPNGTTVQRPGTPAAGMTRYNTSNGTLEYYGAAAWEVPVKSATETGLFTASRLPRIDANGRLAADVTSRIDPAISLVAIGSAAASTTGVNNNFFGTNAGANNTTGASNNFFGNLAGNANTTGSNNNFFGIQAGEVNTSGGNNNFFGVLTGSKNTTGSSNNFFGNVAGSNNTTGIQNNFFGFRAGRENTIGENNNFFGTQAGLNSTTGNVNNFIGQNVGLNNSSGSNNNFMGFAAGINSTTGNENIYFGSSSGRAFSTGSNNVAIGLGAGFATGIANVTGSNNIFIGQSTAQNLTSASTASNNVIIGNGISLPDGSANNQLAISNLIFGTGASGTGTSVATGARVGINQPAPARTFHVTGEVRITDLTTDTPTRIVGADADGDLNQIIVGTGLTLSNDTLRSTATGTTNLSFSGTSSPITLNSDTGTDVRFVNGNGISLTRGGDSMTIAKALPIYANLSLTSAQTLSFLSGSTTPDTIPNLVLGQLGGVFSMDGKGVKYTSSTSRYFLVSVHVSFKFAEVGIVTLQAWKTNGGTTVDLGPTSKVEGVLGNEIMQCSFTGVTSLANNDILRFGFTPPAHTGNDDLVVDTVTITITEL